MIDIKSLDKLRKFIEEDNLLMEMIDAVEREVSERFVELPVDADGEPIRIGDGLVLQYKVREKPSEVESITFDGEDWYFTSSDGFFNTAGFRHVKPRTVEDAISDALRDYAITDMSRDEVIAKYADEICELMSTDS